MKRIDLSDKKLNSELISKYFKVNRPIGEMGERYQFIELFAKSEELLRFSLKHVDKAYHDKIRQNFLINLSSAIEVHVKEIIRFNAKNWNKAHYPDLLSEKISLQNAYQLFKEADITRELIISKFKSFNSLDSIITILTMLTTTTFVSEMENFTIFSEGETTLKQIVPDWQSLIVLLFEERNKIVHEGNHSVDLDDILIYRLKQAGLFFMYSIDKYCLSECFEAL